MEKNKKGIKIALVIFIILFIAALGTLGYGYMKYNKIEKDYSSLQKEINSVKEDLSKAKDELDKSKNEVKNLEESANGNAQYEFDLAKISCESSEKELCTKKLNIRYNNSNHKIKIVPSKSKDKNNIKITYNIYDGNELLQTIDSGSYFSDYAKHFEKGNLDFDGYVYVFDKTNLGFVLPDYSYDRMGYNATFINNEGKLIKKVIIEMSWTGFGKEDSNGFDNDLDSISNLQFDGHMLKAWDLDCNDFHKAIQVGITINNNKLEFKKLKTLTGVVGGGQAACKFEKEEIS